MIVVLMAGMLAAGPLTGIAEAGSSDDDEFAIICDPGGMVVDTDPDCVISLECDTSGDIQLCIKIDRTSATGFVPKGDLVSVRADVDDADLYLHRHNYNGVVYPCVSSDGHVETDPGKRVSLSQDVTCLEGGTTQHKETLLQANGGFYGEFGVSRTSNIVTLCDAYVTGKAAGYGLQNKRVPNAVPCTLGGVSG